MAIPSLRWMHHWFTLGIPNQQELGHSTNLQRFEHPSYANTQNMQNLQMIEAPKRSPPFGRDGKVLGADAQPGQSKVRRQSKWHLLDSSKLPNSGRASPQPEPTKGNLVYPRRSLPVLMWTSHGENQGPLTSLTSAGASLSGVVLSATRNEKMVAKVTKIMSGAGGLMRPGDCMPMRHSSS